MSFIYLRFFDPALIGIRWAGNFSSEWMYVMIQHVHVPVHRPRVFFSFFHKAAGSTYEAPIIEHKLLCKWKDWFKPRDPITIRYFTSTVTACGMPTTLTKSGFHSVLCDSVGRVKSKHVYNTNTSTFQCEARLCFQDPATNSFMFGWGMGWREGARI